MRRSALALLAAALATAPLRAQGTCAPPVSPDTAPTLVLHNARLHTLAWPDPAPDGTPAPSAPFADGRWLPDATALAIRGDRIIAVGSDEAIIKLVGPRTVLRNLRGATVLPGAVDAHTHVVELGTSLARIDLVGVRTPEEAIARVVKAAGRPVPGAWILGQGWDEGAWADRRLVHDELTRRFPANPVYLRGLHGFAGWANRAALDAAGIRRDTPAPVGGTIERAADGTPSGVVRNRAVTLLDDALPAPTDREAERHWLLGLGALGRAGYTGVHEAGVDAVHLAALRRLAARCALPLRVHALLSARDTAAVRDALARGPDSVERGGATVRAVKAYYDGALGSRGARLLADYADQPGTRGIAGAGYGFDSAAVRALMRRGFQAAIHAIGDAGNREVLDLLADVRRGDTTHRDRVEHAQVLAPDDVPRFARLGVIASMQPPHAPEDAPWAGARLGAARATGAYAWRSLRRAGAALALGSDLPGSGFALGYGLHAAVTRQDSLGVPPGGWQPAERLTIEEAVRGYTLWAQRAAFAESRRGTLAPGMQADLTVLDGDPFALASETPARLLRLRPVLVVVGGRVLP
ncbi:MAG: amidohydrolase [Gemmatimonadales bacterium]|nr:amidohydrolase [Gemmatimonadales bacterium]